MWRHADFDAVAELFTQRTGISIPTGRRRPFAESVERVLGLSGPDGVAHFRQRIVAEDALIDEIVRDLAVGETYFFRDRRHFDFVRNHALPDAFRRFGPLHRYRAWSAGCSTGEEPYSLAMAFEEDRIAERTTVLATDLSRNALEHARRGVYRAWSLRGDGADIARKYLREDGSSWILDERIKRRVEFRRTNLVTEVCPSHDSGIEEFDLIVCRNVFIYFDREAVALVARKLVACLREGGFLIMGPSDPSLLAYAPLEPVVFPEGVFFQRKTIVQTTVPASIHPAVVDHALPVERARERVAPNVVADVAEPEVHANVDAARRAFAAGDYVRAAELTCGDGVGIDAATIHVRALANFDRTAAERACAAAVAVFPMSEELRFLHAGLLVESGRDVDAEQTLRRALYLDRSLVVCHALLGMILARRGDRDAARRSFRNAHRICADLPPETPLPLSDGEPASALLHAMARELQDLGGSTEADA